MPHGKICYLEIPATDIDASAEFYASVFGWKTRLRGDGQRAFDDATGAVSGAWVRGRPPSRAAGLLTYVMVDDIDASLGKAASSGGQIVTPKTSLDDAGEAYATFLDPAGNLLGLYQSPRR